jgi:hypothetical protein
VNSKQCCAAHALNSRGTDGHCAAVDDSDLQLVIGVWASLSVAQRKAIVTLLGADS